MNEFNPNYTNCTKEQKEVYWNVCKNIKKDIMYFCSINNKLCLAFENKGEKV